MVFKIQSKSIVLAIIYSHGCLRRYSFPISVQNTIFESKWNSVESRKSELLQFWPLKFFANSFPGPIFQFLKSTIFEYLKNWNFQKISTKIAIFPAQIQENLEKMKISGKNILFLPPATLNLSKKTFSDNHGRNFIAKCTISAKLRLSFANINLLISIGNPWR